VFEVKSQEPPPITGFYLVRWDDSSAGGYQGHAVGKSRFALYSLSPIMTIIMTCAAMRAAVHFSRSEPGLPS
jgi:hypothetical protein